MVLIFKRNISGHKVDEVVEVDLNDAAVLVVAAALVDAP
jgi:hypothetical protein